MPLVSRTQCYIWTVVDMVRTGSNSKIFPAELLPLSAK